MPNTRNRRKSGEDSVKNKTEKDLHPTNSVSMENQNSNRSAVHKKEAKKLDQLKALKKNAKQNVNEKKGKALTSHTANFKQDNQEVHMEVENNSQSEEESDGEYRNNMDSDSASESEAMDFSEVSMMEEGESVSDNEEVEVNENRKRRYSECSSHSQSQYDSDSEDENDKQRRKQEEKR